MITKKTKEEIDILREGGRKLARILAQLSEYVRPGISTQDIDDYAMKLVEEHGVEPVLLGYHPDFADYPYPAALCTSVNNTVQHGVPRDDEILNEGDIINLDMTIGHQGLIVDSGVTIPVGKTDPESLRLIKVTREALMIAVKAAQVGKRTGDIGHAVETYVKAQGFSIVEDLCGHGVGYAVHEEPNIPNYGKPGTGVLIEVGHVFALEPIVNAGKKQVYFDDEGDGYSVFTKDGSRSAHFEHTVAITERGPVIMTTA
jgi:methionyl aminopeptidase